MTKKHNISITSIHAGGNDPCEIQSDDLVLIHPAVSVIIPVYEDWDRAIKCFDCLARQSFKNFEVIAVDNGSSVIPEIGALPYPFQLLSCDIPGSYAARNAGLEKARAGIVAFTDSDCLPDEKWLESGLNEFALHPELDLVAGEVRVFIKDENRPNAIELLNITLMFPQKRSVSNSNFGVTANLFVRSSAFEKAGKFDARLMSSGDVQFCQSAVNFGCKLGYTPDSVVNHPARRDWCDMIKLARRTGGGTIYRARLVSWYAAFLMLLRLSVPPVRNMYWLLSHHDLTLLQKLKTLLVLLVIKCVQWLEGFRVLFGKHPTRS